MVDQRYALPTPPRATFSYSSSGLVDVTVSPAKGRHILRFFSCRILFTLDGDVLVMALEATAAAGARAESDYKKLKPTQEEDGA